MNGADAATFLFKNADNEETKNIARETLYSILNRPEAYYRAPSEDVYTDQLLLKLKTAITLIEKGSDQDKSVGDKAIQDAYHHAFILERSKCLRSLWIIAGNLKDSHLEGIYAYEYLLSCGGEERYAEDSICQIAQKERHPHQYIAAKILYKKSKYSSRLAENVLRSIANQKNHPHQNEAKEALSFCILM
ncbi:MAG: hypothetical protein BGO67_03210 [Alphaproteobacteria bacterium 41-28]|nr:MAG: hypothetical protein BGO67_03210 [Alphaproteobacteria bacterium 41-28]